MKSLVDGVQAGDVLIQVGTMQTRGRTMGAVVDALRGKPGDVRHLVVERAGRRVEVDAIVMRLV